MKHVLQHRDGTFYCGQNLYLGAAETTYDIDAATQLSLDEAERKLGCMREKDEWDIYRVVVGLRLGEKSIRHTKRAKKERLKRELRELGEI